MVLSASRRVSNNKENSVVKSPLIRAKRAEKAQRIGSHPYKTCLSLLAEPRHASPMAVNSNARVLSLPIGGGEHASLETISSGDVPQRISLPKQLQRPTFRPISSAAISTIDPTLADVPIEYIYQKLKEVGERMFTTTTKITAKCPKGRLPRELEVDINDTSPDVPTHVFAIYSRPSTFQKQRVTLHPVHALVLTVHCANLPLLPQSHSPGSASTMTLPILPLCLPSPKTFSLLLTYLYTHRTQDLLSALLPIPTSDLSPQDHMQKLSDTCTVPTILSFVYTTHSLWSNVAALGVFDDTLWRAIDYAWATLLDALATKTGETWHTQ